MEDDRKPDDHRRTASMACRESRRLIDETQRAIDESRRTIEEARRLINDGKRSGSN
jgi:hypothetical protein